MRRGMQKSSEVTEKGPRFTKVAECLYRHNSSGTYYALVKRSGKQIRKSLKTKDRKFAERKLADFRQKAKGLTAKAGLHREPFMKLAKRWLESREGVVKPSSYNRRQVVLNQLTSFLERFTIGEVDTRVCQEWARWRRKKASGKEISAYTFNLDRETLIQILDHAIHEGIILDNPALVLQRRKGRKKEIVVPKRSEFKTLVGTIRNGGVRNQSAGDLVELLAYSGMRLGEAIAMKWKDVDFDRGLFTVTGGDTGTKNREARSVPLFPNLRKFLSRLQKQNRRGRNDRVISIDSAKKAMRTACKGAKLDDYTHHCMRHFFASNAIEAGVDFKTIASWLGHKDGGVLVAKTYGHLRDTHSVAMAQMMDF